MNILQFNSEKNHSYPSDLSFLFLFNKMKVVRNEEKGDCHQQVLLGSMTLGLNVLKLQFVMLANHDQNVLVLFRLAQSM